MLRTSLALALVSLMYTGTAGADPLAQMAGAWRGAGWARETPQGPQETVRCKLDNKYDPALLELTVKGRCAVPGRQLTMAGTIRGKAGSDRIEGRWFNPDGVGSVRITGVQKNGIVAFTFQAKDPETGADLAQNIEWRISEGAMRLRATDRAAPEIMMSDMRFSQ